MKNNIWISRTVRGVSQVGASGVCGPPRLVRDNLNQNKRSDLTLYILFSKCYWGEKGVTTYDEPGFSGKSFEFGSGNFDEPDMKSKGMNDKISSVVVEPGFSVTLYVGPGFTGKSLTLGEGRHNKDELDKEGMDNGVSSIKVESNVGFHFQIWVRIYSPSIPWLSLPNIVWILNLVDQKQIVFSIFEYSKFTYFLT